MKGTFTFTQKWNWNDAGLLRERLFELYDKNYDGDRIWLQSADPKLESKILEQISNLTKIGKDSIRKEVITEVKTRDN